MCVASLGVWHLGTNRRANERKCETCLPLPKLENGVPSPCLSRTRTTRPWHLRGKAVGGGGLGGVGAEGWWWFGGYGYGVDGVWVWG